MNAPLLRGMSAIDAFDAMTYQQKDRAIVWLKANDCGEYAIALSRAWERMVCLRVNGADSRFNRPDEKRHGDDSILAHVFGTHGSDALDQRMHERAERVQTERREDFARDNRIPLRDLR
jgi:hypothetical protein